MIKDKKTTVTEDELDKTRELPVMKLSKGVPADTVDDEGVKAVGDSVPQSSLMSNLILEQANEQENEAVFSNDGELIHQEEAVEPQVLEECVDQGQVETIESNQESHIEQVEAAKQNTNESVDEIHGEQVETDNKCLDIKESVENSTENKSSNAEEAPKFTAPIGDKETKIVHEIQSTEPENSNVIDAKTGINQDDMEDVLQLLNKEITEQEPDVDTAEIENKAEVVEDDSKDDEALDEIAKQKEVEKAAKRDEAVVDQVKSKENEPADIHHDQEDVEDVEKTKLTLEEKRKKELADKLTLEEKRAVDLNKKTLEEKRKEELEHALTLEEKRKRELVDKMTIEEKRSQQKKGIAPSVEQSSLLDELKEMFTKPTKLDLISLLLMAVNVLLSGYVSYQINRYFSMTYALIFFVVMLLILGITLLVLVKKRKVGLGINIIVLVMMIIASALLLRISGFADRVFDNSESETVMIVAKKESSLSETSDFKDQKIAFVKSDKDTNVFAEEMLKEEKKTGYTKTEYQTYKEAYDALLNDQVNMMVYTAYAKQRMEEEEIDSWSHVKVLLQKNREMKAVESKTVDITKDPFNVLISGVDLTSHGINEKGSSDVNIILTVNPSTKKMIMQTIPRDSWAPLTCKSGNHTKLTYAGAYGGVECSISTIEEMYDIEINYYAKINFKGVIDLVDALGGVSVNSDVSFCEAHPLDGYETRDYCYYAGENTLNGVEALMFSRIRKVFADGDLERGKHQMEVVNAVVRKFKEEPTLDHMNGLLGAVEKNFTTNLNEDDIGKALTLFTNMGDQLNQIESYTMQGQMIWETDEVSGEYLYYFFPNDGQAEQFQQRIKDIINGK